MIEHWITTDFDALPLVHQFNDKRLTNEDDNLIGVISVKGENAVTLSGNVVASVIKPGGETISVDGEKSGNRAWIVLPEEAYAKEGKISIFLKLTRSTEVATIGGIEAYIS